MTSFTAFIAVCCGCGTVCFMADLPEFPMWLSALTWFLVGSAIASWCGVVAERGLKASAAGRSRCVCGRQLPPRENVPVLSWLGLRGRCWCRKVAIPARYVATEFLLGLLAACAAVLAGWAGAGAVVVVGGFGVVVVSRRVLRSGSNDSCDRSPCSTCPGAQSCGGKSDNDPPG